MEENNLSQNNKELSVETEHEEKISEKSETFKEKLLAELKTASPLDSFSILEQVEMYEEIDAREVINDVYKEFESGDNRVENIVIPVFTSVIDGLLESLDKKKQVAVGKNKEMGLTATRIVQECRMFKYDSDNLDSTIYSEVHKNQMLGGDANFNDRVGTNVSDYQREKFDYKQSQRKKALENQTKDGMVEDGYQGIKLYPTKEAAMEAEGNTKNSAQYEHIVPLKQVHEQLKGNCMLTDKDVQSIANMEENFVFTSAELNQSKQDMNNKEYVKKNKDKLNRETRRNMVKKGKEAQKKIDKAANKVVLSNMQDPEQLKKLKTQMDNVAKDAMKSGAKKGIGNAILELLKPLYYEMADSFKNGFTQGVGVEKMGDAFKIRMGRIKNHLKNSLKDLGLGSLTDLIKGLISSIISAIVDLFFGIVKNLLKLLQKGIPIAVSAMKILFDKTKSLAERGDAVVKLVGTSLIAIIGDVLIEKIFPANPVGFMLILKSVCSCLLSGCGSLFFMMLMDKIDLFDAKAEKRQNRIREIFEARYIELQERASCMQIEVLNTLKNQRLSFDNLIRGAEKAIEKKDIDTVVAYSYKLAEFFSVDLEYSNTAEFVKWWERQAVICI